MSKYSIIYNNLNSYVNLNLSVVSRPSIPTPERNINLIEVQGRNGTLTEDLCTYKDIEIPISFNIIDRSNINDSGRNIKSWLIGNIVDKKLILSDDTDYYYKVKKVVIDKEIERRLKVFGRFTVTFTCEPFLYLVNNNVITLNPSGNIINPCTHYSEPVIKVYSTGDVELAVNSNIIYLTNIVDYVTIDSTIKDCYKNNLSYNYNMIGDFPVLQIGSNDIGVLGGTGTVTKIEVTQNWRFL